MELKFHPGWTARVSKRAVALGPVLTQVAFAKSTFNLREFMVVSLNFMAFNYP
jgi:hypothetical protein